jgi:hypothetical protein
MNEDQFGEWYGEFCDIFERAVFSYEPDDGFLHTSGLARAFANDVVALLDQLGDPPTKPEDRDRYLEDVIPGLRTTFDRHVLVSREVVAQRVGGADDFQPSYDVAAFEPSVTYGGDSIRSNEVARAVLETTFGWAIA